MFIDTLLNPKLKEVTFEIFPNLASIFPQYNKPYFVFMNMIIMIPKLDEVVF